MPEALAGWEEHRRAQAARWLETTPAERLRWLEAMIEFARLAGVVPDPDRHGPSSGTPPRR